MSKRSNSVSIIGLGYIGLPTAVLLSKHGNYVIGVDTNEKVVETLNSGKIHIKEPGLKSLLIRAIEDGNFNAVTKTEESDIFISGSLSTNHSSKTILFSLNEMVVIHFFVLKP